MIIMTMTWMTTLPNLAHQTNISADWTWPAGPKAPPFGLDFGGGKLNPPIAPLCAGPDNNLTNKGRVPPSLRPAPQFLVSGGPSGARGAQPPYYANTLLTRQIETPVNLRRRELPDSPITVSSPGEPFPQITLLASRNSKTKKLKFN